MDQKFIHPKGPDPIRIYLPKPDTQAYQSACLEFLYLYVLQLFTLLNSIFECRTVDSVIVAYGKGVLKCFLVDVNSVCDMVRSLTRHVPKYLSIQIFIF